MKISKKNSKLGKMPNLSLIPVGDCLNCESCKKDCYALKAWVQYPATRAAWRHNSEQVHEDLPEAIAEINSFLSYEKPDFFRIHVAGDFFSQEYIDAWAALALTHSRTKFLAFTKVGDLFDFSRCPPNLTIIYSQWPGMPIQGSTVSGNRAWMQDGTEDRIPEDALKCPGHCDTCGMCWGLPKTGKDIFFPQH